MKILHTADWHLGASFGPEKRTAEFEAVLRWLTGTIRTERIGALLIAGDVFDTGVPPNSAVEMYYRFLAGLRNTGVRQVIVIAGNHDSAGFLDAPKALLKQLNVCVAGRPDPEYDSQIIPLREADGSVCAAVCAVPFLRDRDVRKAVSGERTDEQEQRRLRGILEYYRNACRRAAELYPGVPLIVTGHFYAGGGIVSGGHVVGSLADIPVGELPDGIAYLALGHLHTPQPVAGRANFRYSGSLLRMSFGESAGGKSVTVLDTADWRPRTVPVPEFQRIETISGTLDELCARIDELRAGGESVWLHAENTGGFQPGLQPLLGKYCGNGPIRVISSSNRQPNPAVRLRRAEPPAPLEELNPELVFRRLLADQQTPEPEREALLDAFRAAVRESEEDEDNA